LFLRLRLLPDPRSAGAKAVGCIAVQGHAIARELGIGRRADPQERDMAGRGLFTHTEQRSRGRRHPWFLLLPVRLSGSSDRVERLAPIQLRQGVYRRHCACRLHTGSRSERGKSTFPI
jgi:hypothetical protein